MKTAPSSSSEPRFLDFGALDPEDWELARRVWRDLYKSSNNSLAVHSLDASRVEHPNKNSAQWMEKLTDAFLLAKLKGTT